MKMLTLAFLTVISSLAHATDTAPTKILANRGDFAVLSDEAAAVVPVFLSYTGRQSDHCGIRVRSTSFGVEGRELTALLKITSGNEDVGELESNNLGATYLVAKVKNPERDTFGQKFNVQSLTGQPLKNVIGSLRSDEKVDLIVEILHCQ